MKCSVPDVHTYASEACTLHRRHRCAEIQRDQRRGRSWNQGAGSVLIWVRWLSKCHVSESACKISIFFPLRSPELQSRGDTGKSENVPGSSGEVGLELAEVLGNIPKLPQRIF